MTYTSILSEPATISKKFADVGPRVDPPPAAGDRPVDVMAELKRAIEDGDYETASRCRRALVILRPRWIVLPLANPKSPAWLGGHHG